MPDKEEVCFVTDDKDYCSPINKDRFCVFLSREWEDKKHSTLIYYRNLSQFFKEHFPQITLASEAQKDMLIAGLAASGNFESTHYIVAKLGKYAGFTSTQLNAIVSASGL